MTNRLAKEVSPYLKMHADNPVDWYPWSEEVLEKSAVENKPILLSIGYTACHWCHVMAHESFEDPETAKLMNEYFLNVKVDREERPDLDKIYQLSAQLLTRQVGGWPLTVFLMPKTQIPFFAGTYFPKVRRGNYPAFKEVLSYVHEIFNQRKEEIKKQNISFEGILKELESQSKIQAQAINPSPIQEGIRLLTTHYDGVHGGFGGAPKFPVPTSLQLMLISWMGGNNESKEMLLHTFKKMIEGGIYDQVGDGFFRYSVDEKWQIPHFEKMLYDNAALLSVMSETLSFSNNENNLQDKSLQESRNFLRNAIVGTADWMLREMQADDGGFFATLSADTEGEEGKFYTWSKEDIKNTLTEKEYETLSLYFGLNQSPNFKRSWHLQVMMPLKEVEKKLSFNKDEVKEVLHSAKEKLYNHRSQRVSPERDEKIIVSWNGLAIKSLALAHIHVSKNKKYLKSAKKCANFIMQHLWKDDRLYSVYKDKQVKQLANLDDYVFLLEGIIFLLQVEWSEEYFAFLKKLVANISELFLDQEAGGFYFTSNDHEKLIYRLKQYTDEAVPSSNAVCTKLFLQLGFLLGDESLLGLAETSLKNAFQHLLRYPDAYASFLIALAFFFKKTEIVIVRDEVTALEKWQKAALSYYQPNRLAFYINQNEVLSAPLDSKKPEKNGIAYICRGEQCLAPIQTIQDFEHELRSNQFKIAE